MQPYMPEHRTQDQGDAGVEGPAQFGTFTENDGGQQDRIDRLQIDRELNAEGADLAQGDIGQREGHQRA